MTDLRPLLVISGLAAEARIAAGPGVVTVAAPGSALRDILARSTGFHRAVVSFGIAGGLAAELAPGTIVIASAVVWPPAPFGHTRSAEASFTDRALSAVVQNRLTTAGIASVAAPLAAVDRPILTPADKRAVATATGAVAVDTESHIASGWATAHAIPLLVVRAVADPAHRRLPHLATVAIGTGGRLAMGAIARELVARPAQLALLPGTALASMRAMRALRAAWPHVAHALADPG